MNNPWSLYDELLADIPRASVVKGCLIGRGWTLVESEGVGMAMTYRDGSHATKLKRPIAGSSLLELAGYAKSWHLTEASIGMAAINAYYNAPERVSALLGRSLVESGKADIFETMQSEVAGKKVAVIGHFPHMEELARACTLSVFERNPQPGDLPDFAEEYVLPEQDYVFITGVTLTNKTLPRLLELTRNACVVLTGPTVPITPILFDRGVDVIASTVVLDRDQVWGAAAEGGVHEVWDSGAVTLEIRASDLEGRGVRPIGNVGGFESIAEV